ncbi:MAG: hypothetical protein AAF849_06780 [Bacteroidota bacterium]
MNILEIVIGIIFVMLLFSLLATTIMETISGVFALRGRNLKKALRHILAHDGNESLFKEFQESEMYKQLASKNRIGTGYRPPSYVSANSFWMIMSNIMFKGTDNNLTKVRDRVLELAEKGQVGHHLKQVMIQLLDETERADAAGRNSEQLKSSIEFIQNEKVKNQIVAYAEGVETKLDAFKTNVEDWYNNIMDRTSGWYKRQTQAILFGIGITIATSFNVDVISIYNQLSANPELAIQIANQAQAFTVKEDADVTPQNYDASEGIILTGNELAEIRNLVKNDIASLESPLGVGWGLVDREGMEIKDWLLKFGGWIVTSFGIMLGAPFWFDLLRKLVNIRNSGAKP